MTLCNGAAYWEKSFVACVVNAKWWTDGSFECVAIWRWPNQNWVLLFPPVPAMEEELHSKKEQTSECLYKFCNITEVLIYALSEWWLIETDISLHA